MKTDDQTAIRKMKRNPGLIGCFDKLYKFKELFNCKTGFYLRTGILEKDIQTNRYIDTGVDPFMRFMPSLIDIGIMGECVHGRKGLCMHSGVQCYQDGLNIKQENMSLENFREIIEQVSGKIFQCALGGRGDPNKHENFAEILRYCREKNIVPNYTTSGFQLTEREIDLTFKFVGAAAVSFYRARYTDEALVKFIKKGVKTNLHYVLSNNSLDEAIERLDKNSFPKGINAIIFLLHKPVGSGTSQEVIEPGDERIKQFFRIITNKGRFSFKIGFDSCSVAGILNYGRNISGKSIEPCEGGRFSCYISPGMKMTPCSFDREMRYAVDLEKHSVQEAWNSKPFDKFRNFLRYSCPSCGDRNDCMGGCPLEPEVTLCNKKARTGIHVLTGSLNRINPGGRQ
jgi:radical SAM protein with 4Fe4S-binding SPASM domain